MLLKDNQEDNRYEVLEVRGTCICLNINTYIHTLTFLTLNYDLLLNNADIVTVNRAITRVYEYVNVEKGIGNRIFYFIVIYHTFIY